MYLDYMSAGHYNTICFDQKISRIAVQRRIEHAAAIHFFSALNKAGISLWQSSTHRSSYHSCHHLPFWLEKYKDVAIKCLRKWEGVADLIGKPDLRFDKYLHPDIYIYASNNQRFLDAVDDDILQEILKIKGEESVSTPPDRDFSELLKALDQLDEKHRLIYERY